MLSGSRLLHRITNSTSISLTNSMSRARGLRTATRGRGRKSFNPYRSIDLQEENGEVTLLTQLGTTRGHATAMAPKKVPMKNAGRVAPNPVPVPSNNLSSSGEFSTSRFIDFVDQGTLSRRLLENLPFEFCTEVQALTMGAILEGQDVMARAKTGTGKTIAFLLPAIQRYLLEANPRHGQPSILVISPTRELAGQIQKEAQKVIGNSPWTSCTAVGGTNVDTEAKRISTGCHLLVATPGRLLDHLQNGNLAERMGNLRCLVLDEADRLLDQGFRRELEKIASFLPDKSSRQTLLFSATISEEVKNIANVYMQSERHFISTVKETDESTHSHVDQQYLIINDEWHLPLLAKLVSDSAQANPRSKIICFFTTARATALACAVLQNLELPIPVYEIHSRKSQPARERAIKEFTNARSAILLSSDVTARGIDIPGVTQVIQVGMPANAEQYIHRLGRTARAGSDGSGLLILAPWEQRFLADRAMTDLPLQELAQGEEMSKMLGEYRERVDHAMSSVDEKTRSGAYQAMLGYYASSMSRMGLSPSSLLLIINQHAKSTLRWKLEVEGIAGLPPIMKKTAGKMPIPKALAQQNLNLVQTLP
ncbi:hypothetical protein FRB91_008483 [Serendipita sp. 411]|nr:hypothetical protein FRB91_008483 [Serendipita sp. 411]